eukprot:TRINITY_DN8292_c0_g1_i4.p1 TRINITY_DN8292_c0_g1~~TRINITY_DN8292_c0_g1_i4.p1  ORF type:complete len:152 (-),score=20.78 TRINITY_DN8292_c0_g1_i4:212-667(-)
MPTYELTVIMKKMPRPQLVEALKRVGNCIYDNDGYIRNIQSLGERKLPNIKHVHNEKHTEGTYMLFEFDSKTDAIPPLKTTFTNDRDIVQKYVKALDKDADIECPKVFDSELLSPSERPSIQEMIKEGRRAPRFRKIWDNRTGLSYDPFHK